MPKEKIIGAKEKFSDIKLKELLDSKDDVEIRRQKFERLRETEKLGNEIWRLTKQKTNIKTEITKLEKRERELLGIPVIEQEKEKCL